MTPGLAFFYGGLVRNRNVISTLMYCFMAMAVVSVVWVLWGYSLAFGDGNEFIGDFSVLGLEGLAGDELLFATFQMMFAIITPALITGAIVERFKFTTYLIFLVLWVTLVYAPICHWVWAGNGWILGLQRRGRRIGLRGRHGGAHQRGRGGHRGGGAGGQAAQSGA